MVLSLAFRGYFGGIYDYKNEHKHYVSVEIGLLSVVIITTDGSTDDHRLVVVASIAAT